MARYRITEPALRDLEEIVGYIAREGSAGAALRMEDKLFAAFSDISELEAVGHRRLDVRRKGILFHAVFPYLVAFRRDTPHDIIVIRVLHGKRDVTAIMR